MELVNLNACKVIMNKKMGNWITVISVKITAKNVRIIKIVFNANLQSIIFSKVVLINVQILPSLNRLRIIELVFIVM